MPIPDQRGFAGAAVLAAILAGGVTLLLLSACTTSKGPQSSPEFAQADLDHNNVVTEEEWMKAGLAAFDNLDTNHDGTLSSTEIETERVTLDRNHDGTLSSTEVTQTISVYDTNQDGTIDVEEFRTGLVRDLGGSPGATSVQRDQVIQQLHEQFRKADLQNTGEVTDGSLLQFTLFRF